MEKLEGRYVPKEIFIKSFFDAKENVNKIKADFKNKVMIFLIQKTWFNIKDFLYFRDEI